MPSESANTLRIEQSPEPVESEPALLGLKRRKVSLSCGDISYIEEGEGPCILLLHGAPVTSLGFVRVIRELKAHYRVIAPDFPGFGRSTLRSDNKITLETSAAFIEEFCRELKLDQLYLFGNDSSGCTGLAAASNLSDRIAGLIIADTVPVPLNGRAWLVRMILKHVVTSWPVRALNARFNVLPWLVATVAPWLRPFSREERRVLISQYDTRTKRDLILDVFAQMAVNTAFMEATAKRVAQSLRNKPALILSGQFDPVRFVGGVSRFREMFPNHEVGIIPFEEHFPILSSGEKVARVIDQFCKGVEARKDRTG